MPGAMPNGGDIALGGGGNGALGGFDQSGCEGCGGGGARGAKAARGAEGRGDAGALARDSSSTREIGIQSSMPPRHTSVLPLIFPCESSDITWLVVIIRRSSAVTWTIQS